MARDLQMALQEHREQLAWLGRKSQATHSFNKYFLSSNMFQALF